MTLDKPTNSKAYARHLLKHIFSEVRDSRRVMPQPEYQAIASRIGLRDDQLSTALQELKYDNLIALDSAGVRLTPQGVNDGDHLHTRPLRPLVRDPLPDSLEEVRLEIRYFAGEKSGHLRGTPEWDWIAGRLEDLRHLESMMVQSTAGAVYVLSGQQARLNINSVDNSTNAISISETDVFPKLRSELNAKVPDQARREEIIAVVNDLEAARGSSSYAEKFTGFLSVAADVMTIISPFIPVLRRSNKRSFSAALGKR
jgi:hypothetical protein